MRYRDVTACFTGHREVKNPNRVREDLNSELESLIRTGYRFFGVGGARGFDTLAAEVVLQLREVYPIKLVLVLPFVNQYEHEGDWTPSDIERFERVKSSADKIVYVQQEYSSGVYYKRNRHLVDWSSICIAYQYKNSGGTSYTTKYATEQKTRVKNIFR